MLRKSEMTMAEEMVDRMRMEKALGGDGFIYGKDIESLKWLIEQAERVMELEKDFAHLVSENASDEGISLKKINKLEEENKRYHEALEELGGEAQIVIDSKSILCPYFIQEIISKALE